MSRFKSTQTAYSPQKKKNVPLWVLDTDSLTVSHYNADIDTVDVKTYHSDYVKYHLSFSASHYPDRLRRLVNDGTIIQYLDDLEQRVSDAIQSQVELWKKTDNYYQAAITAGDTDEIIGLENCFINMAREAIFDCMVYI